MRTKHNIELMAQDKRFYEEVGYVTGKRDLAPEGGYGNVSGEKNAAAESALDIS